MNLKFHRVASWGRAPNGPVTVTVEFKRSLCAALMLRPRPQLTYMQTLNGGWVHHAPVEVVRAIHALSDRRATNESLRQQDNGSISD